LHYFLYFKNPKRSATLKKHCKFSHFMPAECRPTKAKRGVTKKDPRLEGPWEAGHLPHGQGKKTDWEHIYMLAREGKLQEIPAKYLVKYYTNIKAIQRDSKK
jgi:hypothetical protein